VKDAPRRERNRLDGRNYNRACSRVRRECRNIAAFRQRNDHGVFGSFGIVLAQLVPKPSGIHPDYWVRIRIIVIAALVKIVPDNLFLECGGVTAEGLLYDIAEKGAETSGSGEDIASEELLQLRTDLRRRHPSIQLN
jgi:hypothetical protein